MPKKRGTGCGIAIGIRTKIAIASSWAQQKRAARFSLGNDLERMIAPHEILGLLAAGEGHHGFGRSVAKFGQFLLARRRRYLASVPRVRIPDRRQEVFASITIEVETGATGRIDGLPDPEGEQCRGRPCTLRAHDHDRPLLMNQVFAGGHQPLASVEIERNGRPQVRALRGKTGACQGGKNSYCDELLTNCHTLLLFSRIIRTGLLNLAPDSAAGRKSPPLQPTESAKCWIDVVGSATTAEAL